MGHLLDRVEGLVGDNPVVVRVHFGALRKAQHRWAFLVVA